MAKVAIITESRPKLDMFNCFFAPFISWCFSGTELRSQAVSLPSHFGEILNFWWLQQSFIYCTPSLFVRWCKVERQLAVAGTKNYVSRQSDPE